MGPEVPSRALGPTRGTSSAPPDFPLGLRGRNCPAIPLAAPDRPARPPPGLLESGSGIDSPNFLGTFLGRIWMAKSGAQGLRAPSGDEILDVRTFQSWRPTGEFQVPFLLPTRTGGVDHGDEETTMATNSARKSSGLTPTSTLEALLGLVVGRLHGWRPHLCH